MTGAGGPVPPPDLRPAAPGPWLAALHALPHPAMLADAEGRVALVNAALLAMLGLPPHTALAGRPLQELFRMLAFRGLYGPGDPEELARAAQAIDRSQPQRRSLCTEDGRWFDIASNPLPEGGWVCIATEQTAPRRQEAALLARLRELHEALHRLPAGFGLYDPEHRLRLFNNTYERLLLLPPGTLRAGLGLAEVVALIQRHQSMGPGDLEIFAARLGFDRNRRHEGMRQRQDGRTIRFVSIPMPEGGFLVTLEDVTSLREAENEAKRRAALLDGVLAALPHGVCVYGPDQRLRLVNAAYRALMPSVAPQPGDHLRELCRRGMASFTDAESLDSIYRRQLDFTRPAYKRVRQDGTAISGRTAPLPDGGHISVVSDITALHQAEEAARQRAGLLQAMVDSMRQGVCLFDREHRVVVANALAARMIGLAPEEMAPGTPLQTLRRLQYERGEFGQGADAEGYYEEISLEPGLKLDHFLRTRPNGQVIEMSTDPTPDGGHVRVYADVTEERQARAELERARAVAEEANAAKNRFLATMSHELRTPLNAVIGFSEALATDPGGPDVAEFATAIHDAGRHLLALIDEILEVAKAGAGTVRVETRALYLPSVLEGAARLMRQSAEAAGVALLLAPLPAGLPRARAEERRLRQVLLNLLSNAVKFTPAGGQVSLEAEALPGDGVEIRVRDSGIGIEPDQVERAFEPFVQLETSHARRYGGSGLGLYLARALAQSMGATLVLESRRGEGTLARLRLAPATAPTPSPATEPTA
ncbi:PAS-domain containing protein [Pseudoroseomonas cervicalis]|uniref:sensor histidine kinase n=1 Tax=Teichococcus cervicalis TaxID=204525 RepID=UPI0022F17EE2|nr:PAS-domain containing protein [Pseudoroseomonas cervicalis]WBV43401.1 PAS-domain containing protein [Pseudoroseomonas cervicalis]